MNIHDPQVGIIGGTGGMGAWFADLLEQTGLRVIRVGRSTPVTPVDAARQCDVTVVSVPIADTVRVIRDVAPLVPENSLLMDLTSIKTAPMGAMLEFSRSQVVGLHPLFGPSAPRGETGLRIVVCRGRGARGLDWIRKVLSTAGLVVVEMTAQEHDRVMGVVQGINHFVTLSLALCVERSGIDLKDLIDCSTQTFARRLERVRAVLDQPAGLFGSILMENPTAGAFIDEHLHAAEEVARTVRDGERRDFEEMFARLKRFFHQPYHTQGGKTV